MSLCWTLAGRLLQVVDCIMDDIQFEFKDIIPLYTKNDFEWRRFVSVDILYCY